MGRRGKGLRGRGLRGKGRRNTDRRLSSQSSQIDAYRQNEAAKLKARRDELEGWKKYLLENPGLDEDERKPIIKRIREIEGKGNSNEKGDSNKMDVDDLNTDDGTGILGYVNDDDNNNNNNNNNYGDDERKGDDSDVDNTRRSKKMKMDPAYDQKCQTLLENATQNYKRLRDKNRLRGRTLQDIIKETAAGGCGDEAYIQGAIKKSQKRSLISLSRMTL